MLAERVASKWRANESRRLAMWSGTPVFVVIATPPGWQLSRPFRRFVDGSVSRSVVRTANDDGAFLARQVASVAHELSDRLPSP